MSDAVIIFVPHHTVSESNVRQFWAKKSKRAKSQRGAAWMMMRSARPRPAALPVSVTLCRVAPRALDDDNLRGALKHVRDGIADYYEVDDRDPRIVWGYAQRQGDRPKENGVEVWIQAKTEVNK